MKQKTTLTAIGALLPFCIQAENDVRNVLFIAIDDLRPTLGCYGDPYAVTPNIDTFATKSFLFENTYQFRGKLPDLHPASNPSVALHGHPY